jgi:hypothetical protein
LNTLTRRQQERQEAAAPTKPETPPTTSAPIPESPTDKFAVANPDIVRQMHGVTGEPGTGLPTEVDNALNPHLDNNSNPTIRTGIMSDNSTFAIGAELQGQRGSTSSATSTESSVSIPTRVSGVERPYESTPGGVDDISGVHPDLMPKDKGNGVTEVPAAQINATDRSGRNGTFVDTSGNNGVLNPKDEDSAERVKKKYGAFSVPEARLDGQVRLNPESGKWEAITQETITQRVDTIKKSRGWQKLVRLVAIPIIGIGLAMHGGEGPQASQPFVPMPENGGYSDTIPAQPEPMAANPNGELGGQTTPKPAEQSPSHEATPRKVTHYSWNEGDVRNRQGFMDAQEGIAILLANGEDEKLEKLGLSKDTIQKLKDGESLAIELNLTDKAIQDELASDLEPYRGPNATAENKALYDKLNAYTRTQLDVLNGADNTNAAGEFTHPNVTFLTARELADNVGQMRTEIGKNTVGGV